MSIPFDQAVSYYDRTRSEPEWVMDAVANSFLYETQASSASKILEVGIGTGRIAIPLLARGLPIVGMDLSRAMMDELQKKTSARHLRVSLAQADALVLPFADTYFEIVYAVHVYHLVPNWKDALNEARRVLKRGGSILVSSHQRDNYSPNISIRRKLAELARKRGVDTTRPGARSDEEIRARLEKWNGGLRSVQVVQWKAVEIPAQILEQIQARIFSDVWLIPPDVQADLMPHLREWARTEFGDLSRPFETDVEFNWLIAKK